MAGKEIKWVRFKDGAAAYNELGRWVRWYLDGKGFIIGRGPLEVTYYPTEEAANMAAALMGLPTYVGKMHMRVDEGVDWRASVLDTGTLSGRL